MISQNEKLSNKWIPRTEQLAGCLTKQGANSLNVTSKWTIAFFNIIYICNISKLWCSAYDVFILKKRLIRNV